MPHLMSLTQSQIIDAVSRRLPASRRSSPLRTFHRLTASIWQASRCRSSSRVASVSTCACNQSRVTITRSPQSWQHTESDRADSAPTLIRDDPQHGHGRTLCFGFLRFVGINRSMKTLGFVPAIIPSIFVVVLADPGLCHLGRDSHEDGSDVVVCDQPAVVAVLDAPLLVGLLDHSGD